MADFHGRSQRKVAVSSHHSSVNQVRLYSLYKREVSSRQPSIRPAECVLQCAPAQYALHSAHCTVRIAQVQESAVDVYTVLYWLLYSCVIE